MHHSSVKFSHSGDLFVSFSLRPIKLCHKIQHRANQDGSKPENHELHEEVATLRAKVDMIEVCSNYGCYRRDWFKSRVTSFVISGKANLK